jgi:Spy/CpxP family protein refolding chaperone
MMRPMSLVGLVLLGLALAVGTGTSGEKGKIKGILPAGWGKIGLSQEQKEKIYKIQADYKAKIKKLEDQVEELRAEMRAQERSVLTEEQKRKLGLSDSKKSDSKDKKGGSKSKSDDDKK